MLGTDQFSFFMAMVGVVVILRRAIVLGHLHVIVRMIAMAVRMGGSHDNLDLSRMQLGRMGTGRSKRIKQHCDTRRKGGDNGQQIVSRTKCHGGTDTRVCGFEQDSAVEISSPGG